jgi:hypothetical protein
MGMFFNNYFIALEIMIGITIIMLLLHWYRFRYEVITYVMYVMYLITVIVLSFIMPSEIQETLLIGFLTYEIIQTFKRTYLSNGNPLITENPVLNKIFGNIEKIKLSSKNDDEKEENEAKEKED